MSSRQEYLASASCGHLFIAAGDPVADKIGLGAVALRYADMGYPVLPL